ncbi:MAG TPA: Hsp70 family protein [Fimbriimonadaceae bacterium]|jgi:molecular chaperone DnaK (HSP70)
MPEFDNEMHPLLGIDLGTTFSAVARWNGTGAEPLTSYENKPTTQSAFYLEPATGNISIGDQAYKKGHFNPDNAKIGVKREMDTGSKELRIGGRIFTPIQISAEILKHLVDDQKRKVPGLLSRGTVVTVPYYFKENQIRNTKSAADLADIKCVSVLAEPIAAALLIVIREVMAHRSAMKDETFLVFDLGGGTFDLTLGRFLQKGSTVRFSVLGTDGHERLGGMDFDQSFAEFCIKKSGLDTTRIDALDAKKKRCFEFDSLMVAREVKHSLTTHESYEFLLCSQGSGLDVVTDVTRAEFETCIACYLEKISDVIDRLLTTTKKTSKDIDRVILVGGSSLIPAVRNLVSAKVGPNKTWGNVNPLLCVAEGAAVYAAYLESPAALGGITLDLEIRTAHAFGVEAIGNQFVTIIPANTPLKAAKAERIFNPSRDELTSFVLRVFQGPGGLTSDSRNDLIGQIRIEGLTKRPRLDTDIHVIFEVTSENLLKVLVMADGRKWEHAFKLEG